MKTCSQCDEDKPLTDFRKRKDAKYGVTPACKMCMSKRRKDLKTGGGGVSNVTPQLTTDQKKHVYTSVIVRMRQLGLMSDVTTTEMLERVGSL